MPVIGIIADSQVEGETPFGLFVCLLSNAIRRLFGYPWRDVVLLAFSMQQETQRLVHVSQQYCSSRGRPRGWRAANMCQPDDWMLCDALVYVTGPGFPSDEEAADLFLRFERPKKRLSLKANMN